MSYKMKTKKIKSFNKRAETEHRDRLNNVVKQKGAGLMIDVSGQMSFF